jgi:hypothetical protein
VVEGFPELASREQDQLQRWLHKVDRTFGLMSAARGLSRIFNKRTVSLWEIERCDLMIRCIEAKQSPIFRITDEDLGLCKRVGPPINEALAHAREFIAALKPRDRVDSQQDILSRQLAITKWNAIAAAASALAALAAAATVLFQLRGSHGL